MKEHIVKNVFYFILHAAILFCISSCDGNNKDQSRLPQKKEPPANSIIKKPGSSFNDTLIIQTKAAVFYSPDSLQMQKIKAVNEKNIYDMLVHDCYYQMENARNVLKREWPQIKIIDVSGARYLLFKKQDGSKKCMDLNNSNDICGLFLFDTKKDPVLADMPNIATILNYYFDR
ncbi:MAG TPA: hypothetical protein VG847_14810 [Chitinophagaceae bacterium]|nr:hypothetical protein [Chitinophagaceae bacterium]